MALRFNSCTLDRGFRADADSYAAALGGAGRRNMRLSLKDMHMYYQI